ncbi:MAG: hypothetical protein D6707_06080, partial [Bacteroidetes bacterium]
KLMPYNRLLIVIVWMTNFLHAQENVTTFGVQFKPVIPFNYLKAGDFQQKEDEVEYNISQKFGYNFGMLVRKGITKTISVESGLNFVQRNFLISINDNLYNFSDSTSVRIIGYELPVKGLVFIQLSKKWYMNASMGVSLDFFPSNVAAFDYDFLAFKAVRKNWVFGALLANIGYEYRTKESGYFYLGASFHRLFSNIYRARYTYFRKDGTEPQVITELNGYYLTLDFRYFFHEDPEKKNRVKKNK